MPSFGRILAGALVASLAVAAPVPAAPTVYRMTDLDLREPHTFVNFLGCRDITDNALAGTSMNGNLQTSIQTDADNDGKLDRDYLIVFDPVDPAGGGGTLVFRDGDCTAPMAGTSCVPDASSPASFTYTNSSAGSCLAPLAGTVRPYTPAVTAATAPCFATGTGTLTIDFGFGPLSLRDARLAGTYVGDPPTQLVNGLLIGFLSEVDANNTIIPASSPLVGGQPLSAILPGGTGCCALSSDKDVLNGVTGWWFYLNFTAVPVTWTDPTVGVGVPALAVDGIETWPNPSRPSLSIRFHTKRDAAVRVTVNDTQGREVAELARGPRAAGPHVVQWDGRDALGTPSSAGVYFVRVTNGDQVISRRFTLLH